MVSEIKINFRPPVGVSCPPMWPEWRSINNVITKRHDLVKLYSLPYFAMEKKHVISEAENFQSWLPAGAVAFQLSLSPWIISYNAPKYYLNCTKKR